MLFFYAPLWMICSNIQVVNYRLVTCRQVCSYVIATDFGQLMEKMCEALWICCKGSRSQCWC